MAQTNADIIQFFGRYSNALDVFEAEDGETYLNHQKEVALKVAKRTAKKLYQSDAATSTQIYPEVVSNGLTYYVLNDYPNADLKTVSIEDEEVEISANPTSIGLIAKFVESATDTGVELSNFNFVQSDGLWNMTLAADQDGLEILLLDATGEATQFEEVV